MQNHRAEEWLTISEKAKDFIQAKSGTVYLYDLGSRSLCCGRINLGPLVKLGDPPDRNDFEQVVIDRVNVYIPKHFESPYPLLIDVKKRLWVEELTVEGWKLA